MYFYVFFIKIQKYRFSYCQKYGFMVIYKKRKTGRCELKNKAKATASLIAVAMLCHMLLHMARPYLVGNLHGAVKLFVSILLTILRLGIPILIISFGARRLSFGDYSCRASFSYPEYFSVFSASFTVIFLFGLAYSLIFPSETVSFSGTSLERILSAVLLIAVPAVMEEYLIRRLIAGKLAVYNQSAAIIISALIFALMHYSAEKFPYTFVCGLILGATYLKTGSFVLVMAVHFANNLATYAFGVLSEFCTARICNIVTLVFAAFCLATTAAMAPKLICAMKKDTAPTENESGATELLSPALLLFISAAMIRQLIFM